MIEKMAKIQLVGTRSILPDVLDRAYRFGKLHIDKVTYPTLDVENKANFSLKEMTLNDDELKELAELEGLSGRIDGLVKRLEKLPGVAEGKPPAEEAETTKEVVTTEGGAWLAKKNIDQLRALVNKIEEQESGIQED